MSGFWTFVDHHPFYTLVFLVVICGMVERVAYYMRRK